MKEIKSVWTSWWTFTLNCSGVSRLLKFGQVAILSSSVWRKTLWKSNISGRLPNSASIWQSDRDTLRSELQLQPSLHNCHLLLARFYLVFTEERLLLQGGQVDVEQTDEILKQNQKNVHILIKV